MQSLEPSAKADAAWTQISPLLETAIAGLNEKDRQAIILRFFDNRSFLEVAQTIGANEDAARMRVNRALEKMRSFFAKRGTILTAAILVEVISANSLQAAPPGFAKSVTAVAIAKGTTASASTLSLIKGALKVMAWTKAKTALVVGASALLAIGTTTITIKTVQEHRTYPWQRLAAEGKLLKALDSTAPQVKIVPSKFVTDESKKRLLDDIGSPNRWRLIATHATPEEIICAAYCDYTTTSTRGVSHFWSSLQLTSRTAITIISPIFTMVPVRVCRRSSKRNSTSLENTKPGRWMSCSSKLISEGLQV